jgi:multicomponent Na+:H+ antiporter subunit D
MSVHQLTPLPVVIPLLTAAAIVITSFAPRRVHDVMATGAGLASAVLCAVLLAHAGERPIVEWLAGWHPHQGVAVGIALTVDQLGAGAALLAAVVLTAALVYSWTYFDDEVDVMVCALMLVLGAGLIGICLVGDLFTMIVFFVLTTVAAIGLTAVENEHSGPLQGAINFAVVNSIAGFSLLFGAALVYGRTGALNLAQVGMALGQHHADALVGVGLALLVFGLLTKAGAAPFHFWLPDAQAVAPTPVSAVFAGAMAPVALFGVARLLATAFAPSLASHESALRTVLVGVGAFTALLTAIACAEQRHIKRMLAFATASQVGAMLCGIGLLGDDALAGAALTAAGFGLAIAAMFGASGVLIRRFSSTDEFELRGCGRDLPLTTTTFVIGALVVASVPPAATFYGTWLIAEGARDVGYDWLPVVLALSAALTAGTILRVAARVFAGWGADAPAEPAVASEDRSQEQSSQEEEGDGATSPRPPRVLAIVPLLLVVAAVVLGAIPGFADSVQSGAAHFRDVHSYTGAVLAGRAPHYAAPSMPSLGAAPWLYAGATVLGALAVAAAGLRGRRLWPMPLVDGLRAAHSGHVGDYVVWWTFGMAALGGLVLWAVAG